MEIQVLRSLDYNVIEEALRFDRSNNGVISYFQIHDRVIL